MHAVDRATVPVTQVVVALMLLCLGFTLSHSHAFNIALLYNASCHKNILKPDKKVY